MEITTGWAKDFLYGTRLHYKSLEEYRLYFSKIFTNYPLLQFGFIRHQKNGAFLGISNLIQHEELYLELKGYQDDAHQITYEHSQSNIITTFSDTLKVNSNYSNFRKTIQQKIGTNFIVCQTEKCNTYYDLFWWGFQTTSTNQIIELNFYKTYFKNRLLIEACIKQFKLNLLPIFIRKELMRINYNDFNQNQTKLNTKETDLLKLCKEAGLLNHQDLFLKDISFTQKEQETLLYYAKGYTAKEIAETIFRSTRTVEYHIESIKTKLRAHSRSRIMDHLEKLNLLNSIRR